MTPLPLIDGHLVIDNSTLELFQSCPRALEYGWLRKRELAQDRPALNFGAAIHVALDTRYRLCQHRAPDVATEQSINDALAKHFAEHPQPDGDHRTLQLAQAVAKVYNNVYREEPFAILNNSKGVPFIESSFAFPLGVLDVKFHPDMNSLPVIFAGRSDLGIHNNEGDWVTDHKTSREFGNSFWDEMAIAPQFRGYCWAYQQAFGKLPRGYCVNGIRVRKPTKDAMYDENLGVRTDDFGRQFFLINQGDIDEWRENVLNMCTELVWWHSKGVFPQKKRWCVGKYGRCQFYDVCILPTSQREDMLGSNLYQENTWTPLNQG